MQGEMGIIDLSCKNPKYLINHLISFLFLPPEIFPITFFPALFPSCGLLCASLLTCMSPVVAVNSATGKEVESLCPDELDSLFSYFDTSSKLRSSKYCSCGAFQVCASGHCVVWPFLQMLPIVSELHIAYRHTDKSTLLSLTHAGVMRMRYVTTLKISLSLGFMIDSYFDMKCTKELKL